MKKRLFLGLILGACVSVAYAQKIDFDNGTNDTYTEPGYSKWFVNKGASATAAFDDGTGNAVTVEVNCGGNENHCIKSNWWKDGVNKHSKLVGDCVAVYGLDSDGNTPNLTNEEARMNVVVSGLTPGRHSLLAYLNDTDGNITSTAPIDVLVNGKTVLTGVEMSARAETPSASGQAYVTFDAAAGESVTVTFVSRPGGNTYSSSGIFLCALVFDRPNPKTTAVDPYPANLDMHADADGGSVELKWTMATSAVKNHVFVGTSENDMKEVAVTANASYILSDLSNLNQYYWRIDEEASDGSVYEGDVWTFRPRHLAFPGAEGYGRYAIGGRGGTVYHVTNLEDDVDNPSEGSFRYGIKNVKGPRTIVFDVSGYITLKGRLTCSDPYVTIAGQTAPGKGVILRGAPFGMASDGITRFMRMRLGYHNGDTDKGLDGMGMAGNDHSIMDHCSIGWTIDEAFSSRNAKNITLQRTLISEALNDADHPNYGSGTRHGYAATIGGDTGSYHHNLLAHNEGRNWSLSGGLDGGGSYSGHHDVFNNVVYNWGGRATDGGTHECNFVGNYYKMGPATSQKYILNAQLEGTGKGSQAYYVSGNVRVNTDGTVVGDKQGDTYKYSLSGGQNLDWDVFVSSPFFESYAKVETAGAAYKNVLSDVGCNQPVIDNHDVRMIKETMTGTTSTKGCKTGKPGLIDRESDAGGYEDFPEERRAVGYDTDGDGMPDWWETACGLNPNVADNNTDSNNDGYTALEDYLNWMAEPHYIVPEGEDVRINLAALFAGFSNNPYFDCAPVDGCRVETDDLELVVTPVNGTSGFVTLKVTATDDDNTGVMERNVNLYLQGDATGINNVDAAGDEPAVYLLYTADGLLVKTGNDLSDVRPGMYIQKIIRGNNVSAFKVIKR